MRRLQETQSTHSKFWPESIVRTFQHSLTPAHVSRYAAMASRLLGRIARIAHLPVVRSLSFSFSTASTIFDHAYLPPLSFSDVHFYQHVQKTCAYKVIHGVSRNTPPHDAALAGKGAAPHGRNASPICLLQINHHLLSFFPRCSTLRMQNLRRSSASLFFPPTQTRRP
jgi:hypothetical protein